MNSREPVGPRSTATAPLARCLLVWSATTLAVIAVVLGLAPRALRARSLWPLERLDATPFDDLLLTGSALAVVVCAGWLWLTSSLVVLEALTGRPGRTTGCPSWLRRLVLLGCGLALATSTAPAIAAVPGSDTSQFGDAQHTVAQPLIPSVSQPVAQPLPTNAAADRAALSGLEVPDRVVVGEVGLTPTQGSARAPEVPPGSSTVVRDGDSLWRIADARLPGASDAAISRLWQEIWHLNRRVIGADPDLIQPGTRLLLPATKESR